MNQITWINYPQAIDHRGILGAIDDTQIPFKIKRVFWMRDVPGMMMRGSHKHKECEQVIVCQRGCFDVWLNGIKYHLDENGPAIYMPTGYTIELGQFNNGTLCLVLASEYYNENEVEK